MENVSGIAQDLWIILTQGGWVMIAIFLVAQAGWFFILERWWTLRRMRFPAEKFWNAAPSNAQEMKTYLKAGKYLRGPFKNIAEDIMHVSDRDVKAMVEKTQENLQGTIPKLQKHLPTLSILAASAPLLGLLGTVSGIMATFHVITLYGAGNPAMMAGGIAKALMSTEAGLVVAFPLILGHNYLHNRADEIENNCIAGATRLIKIFRKEAV